MNKIIRVVLIMAFVSIFALASNAEYKTADGNIIAEYTEQTDALIREIEEYQGFADVIGTKYYVSADGNDKNDGKSPEKAIRTIERVNTIPLKAGDGVYFKRGDGFRTVVPLSAKEGVTYSAYGEGAKPQIICSVNGADERAWKSTEYANIYRFKDALGDVGTIVFDGGKCWGVQVQKKKDGNRLDTGVIFNGLESYVSDTGVFEGEQSLCKNLEFYHDPETGYLYLYLDLGNPGKVFDTIEITDKGHGINGIGNNVTINNISIFGTGSHAIGFGKVENLTVEYCTFFWIGGSVQGYYLFDQDFGVRYGNSVEVGDCENYTVRYCYSSQVYDCAYTAQSKGGAVMNNINVYKNVAEYCNTGLEFWNDAGRVSNMNLYENHIRYSGYGFGHQRHNKSGNFFYGASSTNNVYENNHVRNNINYYASMYSHLVNATGVGQYNFHDNIYVMREGDDKYLGGISKDPGMGSGGRVNVLYNESEINKALATGFEKGSIFYGVSEDPFVNMYKPYREDYYVNDENADASAIFADVASDYWGKTAIGLVYERGLFVGISDIEFAPNGSMTRAMFATVLYRLANGEAEKTVSRFKDVPANAWYIEAAVWADENGLVLEKETNFRGNENITREEAAFMIEAAARSQYRDTNVDETLDFTDANDIYAEYVNAVKFCNKNGIMNGYGNGAIGPKNNLRRAEAAVLANSFFDFMKYSEPDEALLEAAGRGPILVFTGASLYDAGIINAVGSTLEAVDGTNDLKVTAQPGEYENNKLMFVINPEEFEITDYPIVRIKYRTNSSASVLDISVRTEKKESWMSNKPAMVNDGSTQAIQFNLAQMTGGSGPLTADDKGANLLFKPFGAQTVTLISEKYFVIEAIEFYRGTEYVSDMPEFAPETFEDIEMLMPKADSYTFDGYELYDRNYVEIVGAESEISAESGELLAVARAGEYQNNQLMLRITPTDFELCEYQKVVLKYRTDSDAKVFDITVRTPEESWFKPKHTIVADGKTQSLTIELTEMNGGAGALSTDKTGAKLVFKPFGAGTLTLAHDRYFIIESIEFHRTAK